MISSAIAGNIGGLFTFLEIIFSSMIGMFLLKNYKYAIKENLMSVANGHISQEDFMKQNIFVALGAILLIIPGFFTDFIGLLLQFSFFAQILARRVLKKNNSDFTNSSNFTNNANFGNANFSSANFRNTNNFRENKGDDDVIDVEIIDDKQLTNK